MICPFAGPFTGATGLEPATSGVTDRYELNRHSRLAPGITGWSRHFVPARADCDRLRPATIRQGLCSTCAVGAVAVLGNSGCACTRKQLAGAAAPPGDDRPPLARVLAAIPCCREPAVRRRRDGRPPVGKQRERPLGSATGVSERLIRDGRAGGFVEVVGE